ncbi:MAG TPA: hypothetical protein VF875_08695, partial [Anaeromyxobacter sp.]
MTRWAGWGAGPAGAGAAGPSRAFLVVAFAGSLLVTGFLVRDGKLVEAGVGAAATLYFALRAFAGLGRPK